MFLVTSDNRWLKYKSFIYSGGEVSVKLQPEQTSFFTATNNFNILAHVTSSDQIMELMMLTDALRRSYPGSRIALELPYLPYARQDRVCATGESHSLRVMCDLINSIGFEEVKLSDVHSDVALALLNNVVNIPQEELVKSIPKTVFTNTIVVSPDAGALKKINKVAGALQVPAVRADKIRDVNTGAITETVVYTDHVGDKNFLIVDDLCDGGATFIELAKVLRKKTTGKLYLYVTHGIFSKGFDELIKYFDGIYTTYIFPKARAVAPADKVFLIRSIY